MLLNEYSASLIELFNCTEVVPRPQCLTGVLWAGALSLQNTDNTLNFSRIAKCSQATTSPGGNEGCKLVLISKATLCHKHRTVQQHVFGGDQDTAKLTLKHFLLHGLTAWSSQFTAPTQDDGVI